MKLDKLAKQVDLKVELRNRRMATDLTSQELHMVIMDNQMELVVLSLGLCLLIEWVSLEHRKAVKEDK